jgi:hypothetical protein
MSSARPTLRAWARGATVGLAVAATLAATVPGAAGATPTTKNPAKAAAGWLARQFTGPNADHITAFGSDSPGITVDAVLSLDAAGVAQDAARRATHWLRTQAKSYVSASGGHDPGRLAKLLLVAEAQHGDPHSFGGLDLIAELEGAEQPSGAYTNTADPSTGDNPVSQSLVLIALSHTGSIGDWPDAAAIAWLAGQECGDGGFYFATQPAPAQNCNDVDSTAYAAQALLTVHSSVAADAVRWLRQHRNPDGGYGLAFGSSDPASNANSTAVTVQALLQSGSSSWWGLNWLRKHQLGCNSVASRRGAVKYDNTAFEINIATLATSQAAQALARAWLGHISRDGAAAAAPRLAC